MKSVDHAVENLRVVMIEDHALLANSLSLALRPLSIAVDIIRLESLEQVIADTVRQEPDVVLVDLNLERKTFDGASLIAPLSEHGLRILVTTAVTDRHRLAATLELGAMGFIAKTAPLDRFADAIWRCARGEAVITPALAQQLFIELRQYRKEEFDRLKVFRRLTNREQQVLRALCAGSTVEEIAKSWTVSVATVRSQVRAVLAKLEVTSQLTAVALARKSGWPPIEN